MRIECTCKDGSQTLALWPSMALLHWLGRSIPMRPIQNPPIDRVDHTTIDSLDLKVGNRFGHWFDFGDDWWHQINVEAIEDKVPRGKFPRITKKVGKSPPQYADEDQ
jgi:hypothetical protein